MELFDTSKSLIENISFASSILVSILSLFIIWQLIIAIKSLKTTKSAFEQAQKEFKITSKRFAAHEAAKLCDTFTNQTIKKINQFEISNPRLVELYPKVIKKINDWTIGSEVIVSNPNEASKSFDELFMPNAEFFLSILNEFETFALYFTKNIADEEIAYQTVGKTFLDYIENYHIMIMIPYTQQQKSAFRNTRELYDIWKNKEIKRNLQNLSTAVKEQLNNMPPDSKHYGTA